MIMVLILAGNQELGAHVKSKFDLFKALVRSGAVENLIFIK